jgi:hypothetical protein
MNGTKDTKTAMRTKTYVGVLLAAASIATVPAAAQRRAQTDQPKPPVVAARGTVDAEPLPPGGPPPRMADGHVDLSGVWFAGTIGRASAWSVDRDRGAGGQEPIPFQPWAAEKIKTMTATERQINNPAVACTPVGTPGMFTLNHGYPSQIFTVPGVFIHLAEADNSWRVVHTDGRPHKPADELEPLYNGDQTARWDGDTLVIDSISLDERTWINANGWFHSDQVHVIERLRRPSRNYLEYQYTVEDPKVLTKPWTSAWDTYTLGSEDLIENFCTNNENIYQLRKLYELEKSQGK